jgi:hypothetical protein
MLAVGRNVLPQTGLDIFPDGLGSVAESSDFSPLHWQKAGGFCMLFRVKPADCLKTKLLIRNSGADLAFLLILNPLQSGHLENPPEAIGITTKKMLKMKDDPDELLKTKGEKMTLFGIPMST